MTTANPILNSIYTTTYTQGVNHAVNFIQRSSSSKLATLANVANVEHAGLGDAAPPQRFSQELGGSSTSSMVSAQVPQWMPMARVHLVSRKISTESNGLACMGEKAKRG